MKKFTTAIAKGDTLEMRDAINQAIQDSRINKTVEITEEVDQAVLEYGKKLNKFNFNHGVLEEQKNKQVEIQNQKNHNKLIAAANAFYAEKYPNHVIIPISDLNKILAKYDLYMGETRFYNKLIPQKNLNEMDEFWSTHQENQYGFGVFDAYNINGLKISDMSSIEEGRGHYSNVFETDILQIIAPLNEFKLSKEEKVFKNFIVHDNEWDEKNIKKPVPINLDPIVGVPVKYPVAGGALLIMSQWGPEADLPEFN